MDDFAPETVSFMDDVPPQGNPIEADLLSCIVCGTGLIYGGRGPKPKYCDEHKTNRAKSSFKTSSTSTSNAALVDRAITQLELGYRLMGGGLKFVHPVAGDTITEGATNLAESWRAMLATHKKLREFFLEVETKAAWLPLITAHGDIALAILFAVKADAMMRAARETVNDPSSANVFDGIVIDANGDYV